ncbi:hypothetical protein EJ110_NYTH19417 [Nymphaea thermarum]|nr:hypothetical protein EJ110_NYTH19417 [Nymphaea thermarum]
MNCGTIQNACPSSIIIPEFPLFPLVSLSIDCGDPTGTRTNELRIKWVGDGDYINTGKTAKVQVTNTYYQELKTLRCFPSQKKSCYVIRGVNRGRKHMVRAHFFYGNYDGKSSPPSFDLQFDGNHWATVTTSSSESYYYEVIYGPKRDNISVCVAQTSPDQIPFISALVIREFEKGMYETKDTDDVLRQRQRVAFGAKDFVSHLNGFGLDGILPDFSGLTALEIIITGNNITEGNPSPPPTNGNPSPPPTNGERKKPIIVGIPVGLVFPNETKQSTLPNKTEQSISKQDRTERRKTSYDFGRHCQLRRRKVKSKGSLESSGSEDSLHQFSEFLALMLKHYEFLIVRLFLEDVLLYSPLPS